MGNNYIYNVKMPVNDHGSNKEYTDTKLSLTCGVMTGNLDMNNKRTYNLAQPNGDNQSATKIYTDSNFLAKAGGVMAGNLNVSNNRIINVGAPTSQKGGVNKEWAESNFLKLTCGQMTSNLLVPHTPWGGERSYAVMNYFSLIHRFCSNQKSICAPNFKFH